MALCDPMSSKTRDFAVGGWYSPSQERVGPPAGTVIEVVEGHHPLGYPSGTVLPYAFLRTPGARGTVKANVRRTEKHRANLDKQGPGTLAVLINDGQDSGHYFSGENVYKIVSLPNGAQHFYVPLPQDLSCTYEDLTTNQENTTMSNSLRVDINVDSAKTIDGVVPQILVGSTIIWQGAPLTPEETTKAVEAWGDVAVAAREKAQTALGNALTNLLHGEE